MPDETPRIGAVLMVDDDVSLRKAVGEALDGHVDAYQACGTVRDALARLRAFTPDLLLLDLSLPDGDAFDVLDLVRSLSPTPRVIAISGKASAEDAFDLARCGVNRFLVKPFDRSDLLTAILAVESQPYDLRPQLKTLVGQRPIQEVEAEVRDTMLAEALARSRGNRRGAARLLHVSRQVVQHMLRRKR